MCICWKAKIEGSHSQLPKKGVKSTIYSYTHCVRSCVLLIHAINGTLANNLSNSLFTRKMCWPFWWKNAQFIVWNVETCVCLHMQCVCLVRFFFIARVWPGKSAPGNVSTTTALNNGTRNGNDCKSIICIPVNITLLLESALYWE